MHLSRKTATWSDMMHFDERILGDYRIYVGALEGPGGDGYTATMIVQRVNGIPRPREAYRDESISCGHRWASAEAALAYAMDRGRDMVNHRRAMLTC